MRILLVKEDETSNEYDEIQKGLKQYGYTVDRLLERELLSFIKTETFDVILLDLNLTKRSGLSVLREIRAAGIRTPVLILSTLNQLKIEYEF